MGDHIESTDQLLIIQPWPEPEGVIDRLQKKFPLLKIVYVRQQQFGEDYQDLYKDATILFTLMAFPPTPASAPKLELVEVSSAGVDRILESVLFKETDITFANSSGIHGPQITEWIFMSLLTSSHHYNDLWESQKRRRWERSSGGSVRELVDQTFGVLGYGSIGRQAARVAKAMGMKVVAYTASPKDTPAKRRDDGFIVPGTGDPDGTLPDEWFSGTDTDSLHRFLAQDIDVLLVAVPLTPATHHLLSTEEFSILSRKKAFIANIARGPIIDPLALQQALEEGKLRGAALDVTEPEPLPDDHPLWTAPNVLITPHVSGNSIHYLERAFQVLEVNLERRARGEPLINTIDRKKGY